jgi:predicted amidohydrolase YtcJ
MIRHKGKKNTLLHSGRIYTQNPSAPFYQAMVIADGKIAWLGNNSDLYAIPSDKYDILDLSGKTVLPSFCDAHMHFAFWAFSLIRLDLDGCGSYQEVLRRIKAYAKSLKRGEWLVGKGWQPIQWEKQVEPHKKDLDKIFPNNPVALLSKDEHAVWVNSKTLMLAGIYNSSADPVGGKIARDAGGEPTGILLANAAELVYKIMPPPGGSKGQKAIASAQIQAHSLGITSVGSFDSIEGFAAVQKYNQEHGLKLRVSQYIRAQQLDELLSLGIRTGFGDDRLRIIGAKLYADGALGSQSALMYKPYEGSKTDCGIAQTDKDELRALIKKCIKGGLNVAVHAIGDKANSNALEAIIESSPKRARGFRHRIEHCQLLRKKDVPLFAEHGIIASVQPCHILSDIDLIEKYWGKRGRYAYAFNSLRKSGAALAFGSDAPIEKPDPIWNIYCAVTRREPGALKPFYPVESIPVAAAIRAHTWGGAYALGAEDKFGSITIGNYADIVILDKDLHIVDPMDIAAVKIVATLFEGEFVYGKDSFDSW